MWLLRRCCMVQFCFLCCPLLELVSRTQRGWFAAPQSLHNKHWLIWHHQTFQTFTVQQWLFWLTLILMKPSGSPGNHLVNHHYTLIGVCIQKVLDRTYPEFKESCACFADIGVWAWWPCLVEASDRGRICIIRVIDALLQEKRAKQAWNCAENQISIGLYGRAVGE